MAHRLGAPAAVAIGGGVCLVGAGAFAWHLPGLRVEARQLVIAQGTAGGEPPGEMTIGSTR